MKRRSTLAPQAARDLVGIWRYLKKESSEETADVWNPSSAVSLHIWRSFQAAATYGKTSLLPQRAFLFRLLVSDCLLGRDEATANCGRSDARRDVANLLPQRGV